MAIIPILRELWRKRLLVSLAALVAIVLGMIAAYRVDGFPPSFQARSYTVVIAQTRILLDTPSSQIVAVSPKGSETLGARANLLANLMAEGDIKAAIARRAGLKPARLISRAPGAIEPQTVSPRALKSPTANIVTTSVLTNDVGEQLPIIDVEVQAPDRTTAARLADATVVGLEHYLDTRAASDRVPDAGRLTVRGLGAAQTHEVRRGPGYLIAIAISGVVFLALCWRLASREGPDEGTPADPVARPRTVAATNPPVREPLRAAPRPADPADLSWKEAPEIPRAGVSAPPDAAAR
jgi:hypothetical protein